MTSITPPSLWDPIDKNPSPHYIWPELDECDPSLQLRADNTTIQNSPDPRDIPSIIPTALDNMELGFGKYRYKTPAQLLVTDPGYIVWMYEQTERGACSEELYLKAKEIYVPTRR